MNSFRTIKPLLLPGISLFAASAPVASAQEPPQVTTSSPSYGRYRVEWPSQEGRTYFVQWSEDLETWSYYPAILSGPGTLYFEDTPTDGHREFHCHTSSSVSRSAIFPSRSARNSMTSTVTASRTGTSSH